MEKGEKRQQRAQNWSTMEGKKSLPQKASSKIFSFMLMISNGFLIGNSFSLVKLKSSGRKISFTRTKNFSSSLFMSPEPCPCMGEKVFYPDALLRGSGEKTLSSSSSSFPYIYPKDIKKEEWIFETGSELKE